MGDTILDRAQVTVSDDSIKGRASTYISTGILEENILDSFRAFHKEMEAKIEKNALEASDRQSKLITDMMRMKS